MYKGLLQGPFHLDGHPVSLITAYLFHQGGHEDPQKLTTNSGKSFIGSYVLGPGFTFDDTDSSGETNTIADMHRLINDNVRNAERIFKYINGCETNESPSQQPVRFVINFGDMTLEEARRWPELFSIAERKVKASRAHLTTNAIGRRRAQFWWQFGPGSNAGYR